MGKLCYYSILNVAGKYDLKQQWSAIRENRYEISHRKLNLQRKKTIRKNEHMKTRLRLVAMREEKKMPLL